MFSVDIVIINEKRSLVEENLERWRYILENSGMKSSSSNTEYMCMNKRDMS